MPSVTPRFASALNARVPTAHAGEFRPLVLGPLSVWPPVVLAPMAGVTNYPFRTLCRRFGAGLYVSEMITARGFLEGNQMTHLLASSHPEELSERAQLLTLRQQVCCPRKKDVGSYALRFQRHRR